MINNTVVTISIISWILGVLFSLVLAITSLITKDKRLWETSGYAFLGFLLTGYITFLPTVGALIFISINSRFDKVKESA